MSAQNPFEKFTKDARESLQVAEKIAKKMKAPLIGTELLLLAILKNQNNIAFSVLSNIGVSYENIENLLPTLSLEKPDEKSINSLSSHLRSVVEESVSIAHSMKHNFVGNEHLLLALLRNKHCNARKVLEKMSIVIASFEEQMKEVLEQMSPNKENNKGKKNPIEALFEGLSGAVGIMSPEQENEERGYRKKKQSSTKYQEHEDHDESDTPALDFFSTDFSKIAEEEGIDPVIGREKEIERIVHILNRKTKNNPILIGEPGVGKTAVVEGLAKAIYEGNVPVGLLGKRVLSLDIGAMIAGTKYRGEFEERLKEVIDDAIDSKGEAIIFIDEIHTIVGAGSAEGTLDAANIMKPALSRGQIQVIGATTFDEYRTQIEKDKALERRFQSIVIEEPSVKDAIHILQGVKNSFEKYHRLKITKNALESSVKLSKRFLPERFLPDKAIDLLDEACAGKGHRSQKKTEEVKKLDEKLKKITKKKEEAVQQQNYEKALQLKIENEILQNEIQKIHDDIPKNAPRIKISEEDIQKTISQITGIPLEKLATQDEEKLLSLESILEKKVVGQERAINEISKSIRRSRAGLSHPERPIGTFLFLGPTGVGKTELVRVLAQEVFGKSDNLIKVDMSEFMEKHSTSRLVGATAGYVGYEDGGELTEKVRKKPYSVILFDEIEKAHVDFQNILLQVFEDGFLTDGKGRKIDFRNTLIILTSNIGADILTEEATKIGFNTSENEIQQAKSDFKEKSSLVMEQVQKHFKPEFLGRLDTTVVFKPLRKTSIQKIVEIHLDEFIERVAEKNINLHYSKKVSDFLTEKSFDSRAGGRNVRKVIQKEVEDIVTDRMLDKTLQKGDSGEITLKTVKKEKQISILNTKK